MMKLILSIALFCSGCLVAAPGFHAQQGNPPAQSNQKGQSPAAQPTRTDQQTNQNPFPENTDTVPVMPSRDNPNLPPSAGEEKQPIDVPMDDVDPVRSPEDAGAAAEAGESGTSSSLAGMGNLLSGSDTDDNSVEPGKHGKKGGQIEVPEHHETATEDENVGKYYLDNKDWKAALSRFQSALVLDPDNPDVYWGLAESQRHLGNFAEARSNYQKVVNYDPDSRHGKDARKALKDPEIANAKASAQPAPTTPTTPAEQ